MAARGGVKWRAGQSPANISRAIAKLGESITANILTIATAVAEEATIYMKANHPWTNRTQQAENELLASAVRFSESVVAIYLVQGAPHGIFLEVCNAGRWGILPDALAYTYPRVMAELAAAFKGA